jgi:hypothetical protein
VTNSTPFQECKPASYLCMHTLRRRLRSASSIKPLFFVPVGRQQSKPTLSLVECSSLPHREFPSSLNPHPHPSKNRKTLPTLAYSTPQRLTNWQSINSTRSKFARLVDQQLVAQFHRAGLELDLCNCSDHGNFCQRQVLPPRCCTYQPLPWLSMTFHPPYFPDKSVRGNI